jgi:hypothetical protein
VSHRNARLPACVAIVEGLLECAESSWSARESRLSTIVRAAALSVRVVLGIVATLLAACGSNAPPPDEFVAVPAADATHGRVACPDLTGTFDVAGTALADDIAGRPAPNTYGLPVVMTFKQGPTNIEGWWVVPRRRLASFATTMSEDTPERYARWRGLVLKEHLPETLKQNFDAYLKTVAELGPASPVHAMVVGSRCDDHWMLVATSTGQVTAKDGSPRSQEHETWLARDASGALLVKRITYTLKHYSIWAPATQSIRTSRRTRYARVPQAEPETAEALVASDLPTDPRTRPRKLMTCAEVPERVDQFSQRLNALLPPKAAVTRFRLHPTRQRDADGNCPFAVVDVEIAGGDAYFLSRTAGWVRAEPNVDSVEVLRAEPGQSRENVRRLRVVLR